MSKRTEADLIAEHAGEQYLAWIKANCLKQTDENFQAFMAGWVIRDSISVRQQ